MLVAVVNVVFYVVAVVDVVFYVVADLLVSPVLFLIDDAGVIICPLFHFFSAENCMKKKNKANSGYTMRLERVFGTIEGVGWFKTTTRANTGH